MFRFVDPCDKIPEKTNLEGGKRYFGLVSEVLFMIHWLSVSPGAMSTSWWEREDEEGQ